MAKGDLLGNKDKGEVLRRKKLYEEVGISLLKPNEIRQVSLIGKTISSIDTGALVSSRVFNGNIISLDELFANVRETVEPFFLDENDALCNVLESIIVQKDALRSNFSTSIALKFVNDDIYAATGCITIPKKITSFSTYLLGHEYMHALKDSVLDEYRLSLRYGETIPIFYEIFTSFREKNFDIVKFRLEYIKGYNTLLQNMRTYSRNHGKDKDLYKVSLSELGVYFLSFYYATKLYELYLAYPDSVIDSIRLVLDGQMTTYDMLKEYGLFDTEKVDTKTLEDTYSLLKNR